MLFSAVGTGVQMYSQIQQGKTAARVAQYNADAGNAAAKYNNDLAVAEANNKDAETTQGIIRERVNQRAALGTLRAQLADSGTSGESGTSLDLIGNSASNFQLNVSDAARASAMQAASARASGQMGLWKASTQGAVGVWEGQQAKSAGTLAAIGTGFSGVANMDSAYGHNKFTGALS